MRYQNLALPTSSGEFQVIVTGEALEVFRDGQPLQDGVRLIRHYRSFLIGIAMEKLQVSGGS